MNKSNRLWISHKSNSPPRRDLPKSPHSILCTMTKSWKCCSKKSFVTNYIHLHALDDEMLLKEINNVHLNMKICPICDLVISFTVNPDPYFCYHIILYLPCCLNKSSCKHTTFGWIFQLAFFTECNHREIKYISMSYIYLSTKKIQIYVFIEIYTAEKSVSAKYISG